MKKLFAAIAFAIIFAGQAIAGSTIDPTQPAQNSPLSSAPVRNNFLAAYTDINHILGCFSGASAPNNPTQFQFWCDTTLAPTRVVVKQYDGAAWVTEGFINQSTHTYTSPLLPANFVATPPITVSVALNVATIGLNIDSSIFAVTSSNLALTTTSSGNLLANATAGAAAPTYVTPSTWFNRWCSASADEVPYSTGASTWGCLQLLSATHTWTAIQTAQGATGTSPGWYTQLAGDTVPRVRVGLNSTDVASIGFGSGSATRDLFLERAGAATLRLGAPDSATPVAQTLGVQNVVAGTSNTGGANTIIAGSRGTGTGLGGRLDFQTAPAGSTGSTQNALVTAMSIYGTGGVTVGAPTGSDQGAGKINVSGGYYVNGAIIGPTSAGLTGQMLNGVTSSAPAWTYTPTLGASGTAGSLTFGNATSGTLTIQPTTGALGAVTASFPANTGVVAELNLAQSWTATQTLQTILFGTTNTYDIGTNATTAAPRTVYAGTSFIGPVGTFTTSVAVGGATIGSNALAVTGSVAISSTLTSAANTITSASATALAVGLNGTTNPAFVVDASTASSATGIKIKSAAAGAGAALSVITSGTNENLAIDAAGSGTVTVGGTSTGAIALNRATSVGGALTAAVTNTYDIGTSATVAAFRTIYAGTSFVGPVGTLTTGLNTPIIAPISDGTTALRITKAGGATAVMDFDTTNARVGINKTPGAFDLDVNGAVNAGGGLTVATSFSAAGLVTNAALANAAAYTFKGNATGSSATPTDFTIAGLTHKTTPAGTDLIIISDEAASHATKYSSLAEVIAAISPGVTTFNSRSGAVVPTQGDYPTSLIPGTTTNDNATAGNIGEYIFSSIPSGSAVSLTSGQTPNITSISLTAGDWNVCANVAFTPNPGTIETIIGASIGTTSATLATPPNGGAYVEDHQTLTGTVRIMSIGCMRQSLSTTTTVYLVAAAVFSGSTDAAYGFIGARRAR